MPIYYDHSMQPNIVEEYYRNPVNYHIMHDADLTGYEGNSICGDDVTVYLRLDDDCQIVDDYSFSGEDCSNHTIAGASFLADMIVGASLDEILEWNYATIKAE
jgi:nitrogen fixation protein NifU and related proteins